jgi:hypothetical protein
VKWKSLVTILVIAILISLSFFVVNDYSNDKSKDPKNTEDSIDTRSGELGINISWSDKSNIINWTFATDWIIAIITNFNKSSHDILIEWNGNLVYELNLLTPNGTIYKEEYPKAIEFNYTTLKQGENASFNLYDLSTSNYYHPERFSQIGRYKVWIVVDNNESNRIDFDLYPDYSQDSNEYNINIMFTSSFSAHISYKFDDGSDEIIQLPDGMNVGHQYVYYNHTITGQFHTLYVESLDTGYKEQLSFLIISDGYYLQISVEPLYFSKDQFNIKFLNRRPGID